MSRRIMCLGVGFVLLLGAASNVFGDVYNYWWVPASGDWSDAANWSLGIVPSQPNGDPHYAVVNGGTANTTANSGADRLLIGQNAEGIRSTVNVGAGLDLHIRFELMLGMLANAQGFLNLGENATAYAENLQLGMETGSAGTINVADDANLTVGWWNCLVGSEAGGTGTINLTGTGSLTVIGSSEATALSISPTGHIDMQAGVIAQVGNFQTRLQGYIDNHRITAYGGAGRVNAAYYDPGTNRTTITAIPEPMTMAMASLGLGSLLIRKRLS